MASGKKMILVVDDEPDIISEIVELLSGEGHECVAASSVDEALTIFDGNPGIALVITDLRMPGRSGLNLIQDIRARRRRPPPFIIMSGHGGMAAPASALREWGVCAVLHKPLDIDAVVESVTAALEGGASVSG